MLLGQSGQTNYPDLTGIGNYCRRWEICLNLYNVNYIKMYDYLKKSNTYAPPLNLTSVALKQ